LQKLATIAVLVAVAGVLCGFNGTNFTYDQRVSRRGGREARSSGSKRPRHRKENLLRPEDLLLVHYVPGRRCCLQNLGNRAGRHHHQLGLPRLRVLAKPVCSSLSKGRVLAVQNAKDVHGTGRSSIAILASIYMRPAWPRARGESRGLRASRGHLRQDKGDVSLGAAPITRLRPSGCALALTSW
jgi:hypothetical protein